MIRTPITWIEIPEIIIDGRVFKGYQNSNAPSKMDRALGAFFRNDNG